MSARTGELRGLWVTAGALDSPAAIERLVRSAASSGFNSLFVQVRARADAYYASTLEPTVPGTTGDRFDPLATVLDAARAAGLEVHAWVNVALASSAVTLPTDRRHLIWRHPDWLMVPRALAQELASVEIDSPGYVGRLARWTRSQRDVEGLYVSPLVPGAVAHVVSVVEELAGRYPVDGVHLDYVRYPGDEFDYSRAAVAAFRAAVATALPSPERARLDARQAIDPVAYPDALPEQWARFRREQLTALVARLAAAVKRQRPRARVTAAVLPDPDDADRRKLQPWRTWAEAGLLDAICPMAYAPEPDRFAAQLRAARAAAAGRPVWAGIGAWRLEPARAVDHIRLARQAGAEGIVLFSYDRLA
ncbi:MAG TPA: family 10 glycosylhydrolase, partial [Vicinamibacterales bacterium]|nr:family 10 glycosylhydrolase [Vicinamibacterales bacterium]